MDELATAVGPDDAVIDIDFISTIHQTAETLVRTAAQINNIIRHIDRDYENADDHIIKSSLQLLTTAAGDLSFAWGELDDNIIAHCLPDLRC